MRAESATRPAPAPKQPAGRAGRRPPSRRILLGVAALCTPPALAAGCLLLQAHTVETQLTAAQHAAERIHAEFLAGAQPTGQELAALQDRTGAARRATSTPWWTAAASVPLMGSPLRTVHGISVATDEMVTQVLPDAVRLRQVTDPARLLREDGGIDLGLLAAAEPGLARIGQSLDRIEQQLNTLPDSTGIDQVDAARAKLDDQVTHLAKSVTAARTAAHLLGPALGGSGPRSYFFAFETNAEARGTGGLVGAFGVLTADHGRITIHDLSSDDALMTTAPEPVADLGPDFERRYSAAESSRLFANSNLSAHFPYAAQIWTGLWQRQTGQRLDGAIATDPVGLAWLLQATGPVALPDGEQLTAANTVALTESISYARYTDISARKRFLVQVAQAVTTALLHRHHDPVTLLKALEQVIQDGRLRMWSADHDTQTALEDTPLAGSVPQDPGPYAGLVINNSAGNKLDYYLDRTLSYELGPCTAGSRESTIHITLHNSAPATGLPGLVTLRSDDPTHPHPPGSTRIWLSLYASVGAQLENAELDGQPLLMAPDTERHHLVLGDQIELQAGQTRQLNIHLREPASAGQPTVPVQPLTRPQTTHVTASSCS